MKCIFNETTDKDKGPDACLNKNINESLTPIRISKPKRHERFLNTNTTLFINYFQNKTN